MRSRPSKKGEGRLHGLPFLLFMTPIRMLGLGMAKMRIMNHIQNHYHILLMSTYLSWNFLKLTHLIKNGLMEFLNVTLRGNPFNGMDFHFVNFANHV